MHSPASAGIFENRQAAGIALGEAVRDRVDGNGFVLGMPRGGVPVAVEVSRRVGWPVDVVVARKLGVPGLNEVAFGAIAESSRELVEDVVGSYLGVAKDMRQSVMARETAELSRRLALFRGGRPMPELRSRTVVIVDDGLASGATVRAAARAIRRHRPARIVVAVPVANPASVDSVRADVDDLVSLHSPSPFGMVSDWYSDFPAVHDDEVLRALGRRVPETIPAAIAAPAERSVRIPVADCREIDADVGAPSAPQARGLVIFAHGGGSSRMSYRNRFLAGCLREDGWATLRVDLLTPDEQVEEGSDGHHRFDIEFIGDRLRHAVEWAHLVQLPGASRTVLFGASTGAAAAVRVAADLPDQVSAVMSRGGRVDLANESLSNLRAPLLMMVGTGDAFTLRANREVLKSFRGDADLKLVRGAGHTFEEPGAIGLVDEFARLWLNRQFPARWA